MQRLQPELKKIQNEFRNDRQRMNEEVMRFYQENKVNPVGSCLPLLIQMPVFLILFRVLSGLTRRLTDVGYEVGAVAAQIAGGSDVAAVTVPVKQFDPDYLSDSTDLYQSLSQETEMVSWGIDLSKTAMDAFRDSVATGLPYLVMILLIGVLSWFQQKQIQGRNKNAVMNPQQQMLMKILPFMLPIFSFGFPAGLLVYFIVSSLVRVAQQAYITQVVYKKAQQDEPLVVRSSASGGKSGKGDAVTAGSKQKSASGGGDAGSRTAANTRSSNAARRRRTTAGEQARQEQRRSDAPADRSSKGGTAKNEPATPSRRVTPPGSSARPKKKRK
jgi:YidC/Oxa1 family membrane protein insertase